MQPSERRQSRRIQLAGTALLRYGEDQALTVSVDTRNISLGGLSFFTDARIPLQTSCAVSISINGITSQMVLQVTGVIQRHESSGMAIAFTHVPAESLLHILSLVNLHASEVD